ncbi:MAG: aldehyde dehydrogenase, partial [Acidimicrobiales bacterium]
MSINGVQDRDTLWIGGDWVPSDGGGSIEVISPHTEQVIATVPEASTADVDNAVAAARAALESGPWATMEPAGRAEILTNLTGALGGRAEDLAQTITAEMGSPIMFSHLGQVGATLMVADYYANLAKDFTFEEERQGLMSSVLVRREPVGVVGAIVPWNVPLYVTMLKLAPALAAGATMVLKPAPESPLSAYLLAEALEEVGLPKGVVNVLPAGREVGEHLVRHPGVDKIAFTGSTAAGMKIASICGEQLKRYTLELGGKSAAIILDDADVDTTLDNLLQVAGLMNNGQACVAQTRVLASRAKYDEVVSGLATRMAAVKVGDPAEMDTEVGPLVAERQRDRVEKYIVQGQEEGAEVVVGGGRPAGQDTGWYVEPTLFAKVTNDMRIAQEEIFGPVISAIPFDDVDDAVAIANDSTYGLSGSVWTADAEAGLGIAKRVRTGTFNVNGFMLEPCAPFGGFKQSGVGREGGPEGLAAYLEDKA